MESIKGHNESRRSPEKKKRKCEESEKTTLYLYLEYRNSQGECHQHSVIPGDDVGVVVIEFISNQLFNGMLEPENDVVPRQTKVSMGVQTKVLSRTVFELDALRVGSTIATGVKRRWKFQELTLRKTMLNVGGVFWLSSSKCQ